MSSSVGSIELILKCIKDINNEADEFNKTIKSFSGENKKIQEFMTRCVNEGIFWQNISQKIQILILDNSRTIHSFGCGSFLLLYFYG